MKEDSRHSFITLFFMPRHVSGLLLAYLKSNLLKVTPSFAPSKANSPLNHVSIGVHALDCQAKIFWWFGVFLVAVEVKVLKSSSFEVML